MLEVCAGPLRIACVGAHCDDLEIGAAGTLLRLLDEHPGSHIDWFIAAAPAERRGEAEFAAGKLLSEAASVELWLHDFPDTFLEWSGPQLKSELRQVERAVSHDLVICPSLSDKHQDHRFMARAARETWRRRVFLGYEIPKSDADLRVRDIYVRLDDRHVKRKLELLEESFPSQHDKTWFDAELLRGLMRIRGEESGGRYAEAFECNRIVI